MSNQFYSRRCALCAGVAPEKLFNAYPAYGLPRTPNIPTYFGNLSFYFCVFIIIKLIKKKSFIERRESQITVPRPPGPNFALGYIEIFLKILFAIALSNIPEAITQYSEVKYLHNFPWLMMPNLSNTIQFSVLNFYMPYLFLNKHMEYRKSFYRFLKGVKEYLCISLNLLRECIVNINFYGL